MSAVHEFNVSDGYKDFSVRIQAGVVICIFTYRECMWNAECAFGMPMADIPEEAQLLYNRNAYKPAENYNFAYLDQPQSVLQRVWELYLRPLLSPSDEPELDTAQAP